MFFNVKISTKNSHTLTTASPQTTWSAFKSHPLFASQIRKMKIYKYEGGGGGENRPASKKIQNNESAWIMSQKESHIP